MNIPIVYQVIIEKLYSVSFKGEIGKGKARDIMRAMFRIPRKAVDNVFTEMRDMGLLEFKGPMYLQINGEMFKEKIFFD